jgi:alkanesulfonate monooxygenase SsuD/methylene tetrahydromethanopterin reductase-like flavin-dependent oxidoreductase (luciferase family)
MAKMKFGIAYDLLSDNGPAATDYEQSVAAARLAESLGFDSFWTGEEHRREAGHGHGPAPLPLCAAWAAATSTIRIGTAVALLPAYRPHQIAEQTALVDQIAKGRLLVGLGSGREQIDYFGRTNLLLAPGPTAAVMDEGIALLRAFWTQERVTSAGGLFAYRDAGCYPKPFQKPHPPLYLGGLAPGAVRRAAKLAQGWIGGTAYGLPMIRRLHATYAETCRTHGAGLGDFATIRAVAIAADGEAAERRAQAHVRPIMEYYLRQGAVWREDGSVIESAADAAFQQALDDVCVVGSPARCIATLERYAAAGVTTVLFRVRLPGMDHAAVMETVETLGRRVLPAFT